MSRSTQRGNWNKSEFQRLRIAFERGDRMDSGSVSEDESSNLPSRRRPENRYGPRASEISSGRAGSGALMSPPGPRVASRHVQEMSSQRHSSTSSDPPSQLRGSLTGEYSEEGSVDTDSVSSLDRTHTLAIGEETGQKERVLDHTAEGLMPSFSSHSQSDDSEREDHAMAAQISALSEQNQQLEAQLRDMEQERERLREMLSGEKKVTAGEMAYTPPGLPSKVLDGRKVMKPGEKESKRTDKSLSREEDLVGKIDSLHKTCRELEQQLHEVSEEKRRTEAEAMRQRDTLHKMQDREQDLSKDIETLRDENSHHSGTISKLQVEHSQLHTENASLLSELSTVSEKLNTVQKCYRQAEQENMHLAEDLREMERERDKLYEEKMKLQLSVDDGQKTKENYRLTIRKLREENTALKAKSAEAVKEKPPPPVAKPEKPRLVSKEHQTMDEMIEIRMERTQLQEQLKSAQRDIDSLRTQIKGHSLEKQATNAIKRNVSGHLKSLHSQVLTMYDDLETTRSTVTTLAEHQSKLAREQFEVLVKKCRVELRRAVTDKMVVTKSLSEAKRSLAKLQIEVEVVRATNMKLQSHKSVVADDVSQLRSEVAQLEDQKKMLERQLSQNEKMATEKETAFRQLEAEKKKLKSQLQSNEKTWKAQLARCERDWEDRMAEMEQIQGNIEDEKEDLLEEKARIEERLSKIESDNSKLEEEKRDLEGKVAQFESQITEMEARLSENATEILRVQRDIAQAVVNHACSMAKARWSTQCQQEEFAARESEMKTKMAALVCERDQLTQQLEESQSNKEEMEAQVRDTSEKDKKIEELTAQLDSLKTENDTIRAEIRSLSELRQSAVDNLQQLSEAKQSLQLDNQKIHMTLRTEISLLQAKLKSTEEEKQALEAKLTELAPGKASSIETGRRERVGSGRGGGGSFQGVATRPGEERGSYASGNLRRQVENADKKVPSADLQSRMMMLEAENRRLKDTLRSGKEPPDSNPALRKKIIKLSQRNFFLEWEKKDLSDKLQMHLRLARETKEKAASEQERRLREMNHTLTEKVRGLEDSLLKRRSAIDNRITETVKENGRLHQQLVVLKNGFDESCGQLRLVEETAKWVGGEGPQVLSELQASLATFKQELQGLGMAQKRMRELHAELQQLVNSEAMAVRTLTRTSSVSLPPVLKGLNPSYLSRIDSTATSPPPSTPSTPLLSPSSAKQPQSPTAFSDMKEKFQQLAQLTDEAEAGLTKSLDLVEGREKQAALVESQFAEHQNKLTEAVGLTKKLKYQFDHIDEQDLLPNQLQTIAMLQKQIESLEDQVIDRDAALQEIESQMKQDYEQHDQLIRKLNFEVLDLRNQLSGQVGKLRSKDVYIQQADSRYLELETQLISLRKELERLVHEREQLVANALPEHLKMVAVATGGPVSLSDVIRLQGDEIRALQKSLVDYSYQLTQLHQQLTSADRQRNTLKAKLHSEEIMQQQMKENLTAEINFLRTLNMQFAEQQAKGDKGKVLLEEVRKVKEALRQQKEATEMQRELDAAKVKILEQETKLEDLNYQLHTQQLSLTMLQADKQHALSSISQDMTGQMPSAYLVQRRPMSAGSEGGGGACRRPNYHFLNRAQPSSRNSLMQTEFAIQIPGSEIVDLEEHSEGHHNPLSLGPAVVTDDEGSRYPDRDASKMEKIKHQQIKKIRRHRRTASMGSNIIDVPPREVPNSTATLPLSASSSSRQQQYVNIVKPKPLTVKQQLNRPGSAGSNPTAASLHRVHSPEKIKETAHEVMKGITKLIEGESGGSGGGGSDGEVGGEGELGERANSMRRVKSGGGEGGAGGAKVRFGEGEGSSFTRPDHPVSVTSSLPVGMVNKTRHKHDASRSKPGGKSAEATTSDTQPAAHPAPASSSGGSSTSKKSLGGWTSRPPGTGWLKKLRDKTAPTAATAAPSGGSSSVAGVREVAKSGTGASSGVPDSSNTSSGAAAFSTAASSHTGGKFSSTLTADLSRTPSILSTSSTISTFPPSTLPSRNPSFAYDGGGESSPHSLESVEIGDSIENLLALQSGRMNYSYFIPIRTKDTTSSSDEDSVRGYRYSRRKRSSGTNTDATTHSTQQSKDEDDNSNSSNDSDQVHGRGGSGAGAYQRGSQSDSGVNKSSAPVCRHESISITAIEDCPTDHEVDEKANQLKKSFPRDRQGRLRTSSTGSIHICYSDSNTSMEDVSKNF